MIEKIKFHDAANYLKITNGTVDVIVSTEFGPRILFYGFANGGENILGWHPEAEVKTKLGTWRPYGGHRLWIAPENMPLSYAPDNEPVEYFTENDLSVRLFQPIEKRTKTQKEIFVSLSDEGSEVTVEHRITYYGRKRLEIAAWALTIMRGDEGGGGGSAIIPNEDFKPYSGENLLPVRSLALWSYTDLTDARWQFEKDFIRLKVDDRFPNPQKIGVLNKNGWAAYEWRNLLFVKKFDFVEKGVYPDMNSNTEVYTAGSFVEVESLSPLKKMQTGESIIYTETWKLFENTDLTTLISEQK